MTAAAVNALLELAGRRTSRDDGAPTGPPFEIVRGPDGPPSRPAGDSRGVHHRRLRRRRRRRRPAGSCSRDERPEVVAVPSPLGFDLMIPINRLAYADGVGDGRGDQGRRRRPRRDPRRRGPGRRSGGSTSRASTILGGPGVGTITQPGLELPPGSAGDQPGPPADDRRGGGPGRAGRTGPSRASRSRSRSRAARRSPAKTLNARIGDPRRDLDPGDDRGRPADEHGELAGLGRPVDRRRGGEQPPAHRPDDRRAERAVRRGALPRPPRDGVRPDGDLHRRQPEAGRRAAGSTG